MARLSKVEQSAGLANAQVDSTQEIANEEDDDVQVSSSRLKRENDIADWNSVEEEALAKLLSQGVPDDWFEINLLIALRKCDFLRTGTISQHALKQIFSSPAVGLNISAQNMSLIYDRLLSGSPQTVKYYALVYNLKLTIRAVLNEEDHLEDYEWSKILFYPTDKTLYYNHATGRVQLDAPADFKYVRTDNLPNGSLVAASLSFLFGVVAHDGKVEEEYAMYLLQSSTCCLGLSQEEADFVLENIPPSDEARGFSIGFNQANDSYSPAIFLCLILQTPSQMLFQLRLIAINLEAARLPCFTHPNTEFIS